MPFARLAAVALAISGPLSNAGHAASVSYYLDQSNALADGINYLQVTVSDDGLADPQAIQFTVDLLSPLTGIAGTNFGIQRFAFNTNLDWMLVADAIENLPSGWRIRSVTEISGFGVFELVTSGTGSTRVAPQLTFSIDSSGLIGDTVYDYAIAAACPSSDSPATCIPSQGPSYFAAHVAGFSGPNGISSAYFGGSTPASGVVPVPAAVWLMGSALGLLGGLRRRQRRLAD
jgi:hypothetical protein